jgi:hypothetical protein
MKALFDQAPATVAVREHPMRELMEARAKMEQWGEQVRLMKELLELPEVSAADKMALGLELMTAKSCMLACANIITACEERMRQQARRLEERWGWLLG